MDVTRLYNLTTPELRSEAIRLGVEETATMSRAQLIDVVKRSSSGRSPAKRGLFGRMVGFAKWAAGDLSSDPTASAPAPSTATSNASPAPSASVSTASTTPDTYATANAAPTPGASTTSSVAPASSAPQASPRDAKPTDTSRSQARATNQSAPAGVFAVSASALRGNRETKTFEEPFPTRTMARILSEQGHHRRALAIYTRLVAEHPNDKELRAEAEGVGRRKSATN